MWYYKHIYRVSYLQCKENRSICTFCQYKTKSKREVPRDVRNSKVQRKVRERLVSTLEHINIISWNFVEKFNSLWINIGNFFLMTVILFIWCILSRWAWDQRHDGEQHLCFLLGFTPVDREWRSAEYFPLRQTWRFQLPYHKLSVPE